MPFVKLDCGLLKSTLWFDHEATRLFLTALLDAKPIELKEPTPTYDLDSTEPTDFVIPPGWYGLVESSAPGLIHDAMMPLEAGTAALKRLASPEAQSRTPTFAGRRLVRVSGGFVVLNFQAFRDKDYGAKDRARRYRERERARRAELPVTRNERRSDRNERRLERKEKEKEKQKHKHKKEGTYVPVIEGNGTPLFADFRLRLEDTSHDPVTIAEVAPFEDQLDDDELSSEIDKLCRRTEDDPTVRPKTPTHARSLVRSWLTRAVDFKKRDEATR